MAFRASLLKEILFLSLDTLRANKLRSALTILGVVIGVSSVVGMTSLIRGFGDQMTGLVQQMGASTVYVAKLSIASLFSGRNFFDLLKRPDITEADAKAIKELCPSVDLVGIQLGGGPAQQPQRFTYRDKSTKAMQVIGSTANFPETNYLEISAGRFFSDYEVSHRRQVVVLGLAPTETLFPQPRSDRQESADRRRRLHGDRHGRQTAEPARRKSAERVRGDSDHDLRQEVRHAAHPRHARDAS